MGLFQKGRVLAQDGDGFLLGKRYLIHDRDPLFTEAVRGLLRGSGVKPLRLPEGRILAQDGEHLDRDAFQFTIEIECKSVCHSRNEVGYSQPRFVPASYA